MDELEAARRLGREGQQAIGLSIQEQGAYDKGRRERAKAMEAWTSPNTSNTSSGDGTGGAVFGALFALALIAPAFAAPAAAVWATWTWLAGAYGWDWPVLTAICVVEAIAILFVLKLFYDRTPAVIVAVVASLYLGIAYAFCAPLLTGMGFVMSAIVAIIAAVIGFLAGLTAPNKWMSAPLLAAGVAIVLGVFVNVAAERLLPYELYPLFAPIKWAGAGLALGGVLRLALLSKWSVLGVVAVIGFLVFFAPAQLSAGFDTAIGLGMPFFGTF